MVPCVSRILPWYVVTRTLGLVDTYPPLIATHLVFLVAAFDFISFEEYNWGVLSAATLIIPTFPI
jgi:ABC-type glycerol-3-phosphate transport system permease component